MCTLATLELTGPALKPGRVIRVNRITFSPGHQGPTQFTNYPGLTGIGSREKLNCSFDEWPVLGKVPACGVWL